MGMHDFISEQAAINVTGMSSTTLTRFAEAGYLQQDIDADGLRFYSKAELLRVFGSAPSGDYTPPTRVEVPQSEVPQSCHVTPEWEGPEVIPAIGSSAPMEGISFSIPAAEHLTVQTSAEEPIGGSVYRPEAQIDSETVARLSRNEAELVRLTNLVQMQEKILDLKDAALEALRKERDWLRVRIERLEEKSDRDQLLLLSETQTIRKLIIMSDRRRSTFRQLMEWAGIVERPETERLLGHSSVVETSGTPEMSRPTSEKRAANG
jgi:hypothetical protein